jgi:hypothetical protein
MRFVSLAIFWIGLFSSCKSDSRKVELPDSIAEGNISQDTIFNGLIRFYDKENGKLELEASYANDVLQGSYTEYYQNGKGRSKGERKSGELYGPVSFFDTSGQLLQTQYNYFGLRCGPSVHYTFGKPVEFFFYSLDGAELMHINDDSLKSIRVEDLNNSQFFFWHTRDYSSTFEFAKRKTELFVYLPNPPHLSMKYSVCITDAKGNIVRTVEKLVSELPWKAIELNKDDLQPGQLFCLALEAENQLRDDGKVTMIKRL